MPELVDEYFFLIKKEQILFNLIVQIKDVHQQFKNISSRNRSFVRFRMVEVIAWKHFPHKENHYFKDYRIFFESFLHFILDSRVNNLVEKLNH